ncbi:MAG: YicC family protein [Parvularcula sp.]|nr:YicC family protein [Parvularcula sp.]
MTGFARAEGAYEGWRFVWEVRSVNGRGLEWRARLPAGFEALDPEMRKLAKAKLVRGTLNIGLNLRRDAASSGYAINQAMLGEVIAMVEKIRLQTECAPPRPDGLLALKGVIEQAEEEVSEEGRAALYEALLATFGEAIDALAAARRKEGEAMGAVLAGHFDMIEKLNAAAADNAAAMPAAIRDRIAGQLKELLESAVPDDRLAQEASLLAIKADVREELDRLASHIEAGRALLEKDGAVGRDLDFLTQELNREANTLCSKAQDMELKRIGLDLKRVIDQVREQVQNIE